MATEMLDSRFVMILTFLGTFVMLVGFMPQAFLTAGEDYVSATYPEGVFRGEDIEGIAYFRNVTLTGVNPIADFNPNVNVKIRFFWEALESSWHLQHLTWEWWIFYNTDSMSPEGQDAFFSKQDLIDSWDAEINASYYYPVRCNHLTIRLSFTDSNITRNNIGDAWDDSEVVANIGFGIDDYETAVNAWDLVGRLLTFQPIDPQISGQAGFMMGFLFSFPLWCAIAFLIARLILLALPFVG